MVNSLQDRALLVLNHLRETSRKYHLLNKEIAKLQNTDFPTHLSYCDGSLESSVIDLLNEIIGHDDLVSYFLYECERSPGRISINEKEYIIDSIEDIQHYLEENPSHDEN